MAVFKDAEELYRFTGGIFEEAFADPVVGDELAKSGVVLKLHHTEPQAAFIVDMPAKKVLYGDDAAGPGAPKPSVDMFMKADMAHKFWLGKVNISMALAKGDMRAKGNIAKILKLVPIAKQLFPKYRARLESAGRTDLIEG